MDSRGNRGVWRPGRAQSQGDSRRLPTSTDELESTIQLVLKVTPIAHAKSYEVRLAICIGNAPGPWQAAGVFTNSRSMTIDGLTPGTTYMFQVRAVGGSTRYSF